MQTLESINLQQFMAWQLQDIFETMFSMRVQLANDALAGGPTDRVSGSVGFAGEVVSGAVYLHLPQRFAAVLASCMLGTSVESVTEAEVNDVVGETTNMLAGGLKSRLGDAGFPCAVSTPAIIRGHCFTIEVGPEVQRHCLIFSCGPHGCAAEVHYKEL